MDESTSPDAVTLRQHLKRPRVLAAVDSGRWMVLEDAFPDLYVRVRAQAPEADVQVSLDFHLRCDGYPESAPFAERWDHVARVRPGPPTEGPPSFLDAMKDWGPGGIYRAWQRTAADHNGWALKRPDLAWHREREISFILEELYALAAEKADWLAARR